MTLSLTSALGGGKSLRAAATHLGLPQGLSARRLIATHLIDDRYQQEGGRLGFLGHPLSEVHDLGDGLMQRDFEGGDLHITDTGTATNRERWQTTVRYKGLHCFGETAGAGSDEPYVVVGVYAASKREKAVVTWFGTYENVEDGTTRFDPLNVWTEEPPTDLVVHTTIVEHDAGEPQDVVNEVRVAIARAADALDAADSAGKWLNDALGSEFLGDIIGGIGSLVGLGDNPIGAEAFVITQPEAIGYWEAPLPVRHIDGLEYTTETPLISDGDASYKAYFDVFTDKIISGQRAPVP